MVLLGQLIFWVFQMCFELIKGSGLVPERDEFGLEQMIKVFYLIEFSLEFLEICVLLLYRGERFVLAESVVVHLSGEAFVLLPETIKLLLVPLDLKSGPFDLALVVGLFLSDCLFPWVGSLVELIADQIKFAGNWLFLDQNCLVPGLFLLVKLFVLYCLLVYWGVLLLQLPVTTRQFI